MYQAYINFATVKWQHFTLESYYTLFSPALPQQFGQLRPDSANQKFGPTVILASPYKHADLRLMNIVPVLKFK